jgi:very-short-patch-repair endonuclease
MKQKHKDLPQNSELRKFARELRKAGNLSEVLLWQQIKGKQLLGLDFDRQFIIGNYIVDFFCPSKRVVIEIDGYSHIDKGDYDDRRDKYLKNLGLNIIHLLDSDIKNNLDGVIRFLMDYFLSL